MIVAVLSWFGFLDIHIKYIPSVDEIVEPSISWLDRMVMVRGFLRLMFEIIVYLIFNSLEKKVSQKMARVHELILLVNRLWSFHYSAYVWLTVLVFPRMTVLGASAWVQVIISLLDELWLKLCHLKSVLVFAVGNWSVYFAHILGI